MGCLRALLSRMSNAPRKILVPVDFSEASLRALERARELSPPLDANLVLLHVMPPPALLAWDLPPSIVARAYEEALPAARAKLEALATEVGGRAVLREGDPGPAIAHATLDLEPTLVVMGTHGRQGLRRFTLGSVAEYVVRHAHAPVMTVRAPET
jgi:universal stress protein A